MVRSIKKKKPQQPSFVVPSPVARTAASKAQAFYNYPPPDPTGLGYAAVQHKQPQQTTMTSINEEEDKKQHQHLLSGAQSPARNTRSSRSTAAAKAEYTPVKTPIK